MSAKIALSLALIGLFICTGSASSDKHPERTLEVKWNPDCTNMTICGPEQNGSYVNVLYVKATGKNDIVHYLYSTIESFAILMFKSDLKGQLSIDWEKLLKNEKDSIQIKGSKIIEKSAYIVPMIYEFEDQDGKADMTQVSQNASSWTHYPTSSLVWSKFTEFPESLGVLEGKASVDTMNGTSPNSFKFVIKNRGTDSRDKELPHLLLTPQSTSVDLIIDVPAKFHLSKFGAEIMMMSGASSFSSEVKTSMDDEYTPGTFKLWNFQFVEKNTTSNYLQCKPIFYYYEPKALENSTLAIKYDVETNHTMPSSIASALFTEANKVYAMNVSFGIEGGEKDGFFHSQTNYTIWSFSLGFGNAPVEKMSFVVTLVIAIGFGLPAFIIVAGIFVMIVRKLKNGRRSEFETLE